MDKTNNKKQQLLLEYLVSSADTFALCKTIIKPDYFDPEYRKSAAFIHEYYEKFSTTPDVEQIEAETGVALKKHTITRDKISYCSEEIEQFCKRKAAEQVAWRAPAMIAEGKYAELDQAMRDATSVSLNKDMGIDYFEGKAERMEKRLQEPGRTSTGWPQMDELMAGGLARKEILLFSANSGGGKSITLANLAVNFMKQNLNVLYISLELSEDMIEQRFDTMFTGISSVIWKNKWQKIVEEAQKLAPTMGKLKIKRMPSGTCANDIRAYLKEFELKYGYVPDLLIVDYLDIMNPNERVSADLIFEKDKRATEQLRDILFDYNMYCATASQQNRGAIDATELNQSHIAGGISKVNTVDWYASIIMNAAMRAAGEIGFQFLKTRSSDGVGKSVYLGWNAAQLLIYNNNQGREDNIDDDGVITKKKPSTNTAKPTSFLDLMDADD